MKKTISIVLLATIFIQCKMKENQLPAIDITKAEINIDDCGITYKGERLPFGVTIKELEKKYGKTRATQPGNTWDDIGIGVKDWDPDVENTVNMYYIFFTNMDTPEGKAGGLSFCSHSENSWPLKPFDSIIKEYKDIGKPVSDELRAKILENTKKDFDPVQYFYPYKTYQGVVNVQGAPVKAGMSLKEINALREATKKLDIFTFWDRNMNMVDETLTTEGKRGEYFQRTSKECDGKLYTIVLFFDDYKLEYLSIEKVSKSDMQMIKDLTE